MELKYDVKKHSKTLELNKVLELLAGQASTAAAAENALKIEPSFDFKQVRFLLKQTDDAFCLSAQFGSPSFGRLDSLDEILSRTKNAGQLNAGELLKIGELLSVIRTAKLWRSENGASDKNSLDNLFNILTPNKYLENEIFGAIVSPDEISDNASTTLFEIRKKIRKAGSDIREKLDRIVRSGASKFLQDGIITQREGRFVVPVKAEHKSELPGLVHDTSSSGATLFVEPMVVVEINNGIRVLQNKEKDEIDRILYDLSVKVSEISESLSLSYSALVDLDLIFAKASLAYKMRAVAPVLNDKGIINLKNARHPLIDAKKVVPINISLGKDYKMLLITGPNTGGKTVSIKTVGLLTLMAQCGLMVPCDSGSELSVFGSVLSDIGDEQSIEQSLSTFSSHIKNIIKIAEICDNRSLVLLDELCAGTDPIEGAALAQAILEKLLSLGATVCATTHYAELKSFALTREDAQNACCEFSVETLSPTYRLLIGVPGSSNAFEISKRLGLDQEIVMAASSLISGENRRFDEVISQLLKAHSDVAKEREAATEIRQNLEKNKRTVDTKLSEVDQKSEKILENARRKAEDILEYAKSESNRLLNELEDMRSKINKENSAEMILKARSAIKGSVKNLEKNADSNETKDKEFDGYVLPRELIKGDTLKVKGFPQNGTFLSRQGDVVTVSIGSMLTKVSIKDVILVLSQKPQFSNKRTVKTNVDKAASTAKTELDIRGFAADEGIMELEKFIDSSIVMGIETVYVIHGKGTGVLRSAVRQHLKTLPVVKSFRPGVYGEGENGVTVVT
ncbi:MAG: endonuclease MutS2, partial [Oscillospiraceae bacterium]|nr:endonuclease MutS2 [Candidatus Equicaccousia limihippi]